MRSTAPLYKNFVRLTLLEEVNPEYLIRFLRPFEDYLAARGIRLDGATVDDPWLTKLHHVLASFSPEAPAELQQALLDVADLANEQAHEQLLELAQERQLKLFNPDRALSPTDLAFKTYLEHSELFASIRARVLSHEPRRLVEFYPRVPRPLTAFGSEEKLDSLRRRLGRWFGSRNRTPFCELRVVESDTEVLFLVIHGRPPATHGVIRDASRSRVSYIRDKQDLVVFTKNSGKIAVNAQFPTELDFYRLVFGEVFFGDARHFAALPVFTGAPLLEGKGRALTTEGFPALANVTVRALRIVSAGRQHQQINWSGDNLAEMLDSPWGRKTLEMGHIRYLRLAFYLRGIRRPLIVEITLPNKLKYDRRFGEEVVREFLLARGFITLPAPNAQLQLAMG